MTKPKETEFLHTFLTWCIEKYKAEVWTEVRVENLGVVDAVVKAGNEYWAIEGKRELTYTLLGQCLRMQNLVSKMFAVIPSQRQASESFLLAKRHFEYEGVGIFVVIGEQMASIGPSPSTSYDGIKAFLRDSQRFNGSFAPAGSAGGRRASKQNEDHQEIETYIAKNPHCTAAEAARHGGMKASVLLRLIKQGKVRAVVEVVGGKSQLVAKENT